MTNFTRGQKGKLADLGLNGPFAVTLDIVSGSMEVDVSCFGVDAAGKLTLLQQDLSKKYHNSHFQVPYPTLNFGAIHGGDSPNRICGCCELQIDLRPIPGVSPQELMVMLEENLPQQAAEKGDYLLQKIGMLRNKYPHILKDIRGKGLLLAMVFENDEIGYKVVSGLFKRHVLTSGTLNNSSVVRLEPALNIPYELLDEVLVRLEDTLKSVSESVS